MHGWEKKVRGVILDSSGPVLFMKYGVHNNYGHCVILDWYGTYLIHEIWTLCSVQFAYRKLVAHLIRLFPKREIKKGRKGGGTDAKSPLEESYLRIDSAGKRGSWL